MTQSSGEQILLFDGLCNFCDGTVQFILAHDRTGTLKFAPLQGEFARELMTRHPELASLDSLMLVERAHAPASSGPLSPAHTDANEIVLVRSAAVLAIANYLGGLWRVPMVLAKLLPRSLRDAAYNALARRRIRLFGRLDACRVPDAQERARFLD